MFSGSAFAVLPTPILHAPMDGDPNDIIDVANQPTTVYGDLTYTNSVNRVGQEALMVNRGDSGHVAFDTGCDTGAFTVAA